MHCKEVECLLVKRSMIFSVIMKQLKRTDSSSEMLGSSCLMALSEQLLLYKNVLSSWKRSCSELHCLFSRYWLCTLSKDLQHLRFVRNRTDFHRTKMFVFSCRSGTKDERTPKAESIQVGCSDHCQARRPKFSLSWRSSHYGLVEKLHLKLHFAVLKILSGAKYPGVMLLGQPHPVLNLWKSACPI